MRVQFLSHCRYDMTKPDTLYDSSPQKRTIEDLRKCCHLKKGKNFCCINPPLLDIPLDHIILDELHLLLRITDVLTPNVLDEVIEWGDEEAQRKKVSKPATIIGQHLQEASFGVKYDRLDADADTHQGAKKIVHYHDHLAFEQTLMWSKC